MLYKILSLQEDPVAEDLASEVSSLSGFADV
jgi:hypothetical protein